jgi:hypothetical protein
MASCRVLKTTPFIKFASPLFRTSKKQYSHPSKSLAMPFTELVVLSLQQTEEARSAFDSPIKPALSSIIQGTPAAKDQFFGRIISENEKPLRRQ